MSSLPVSLALPAPPTSRPLGVNAAILRDNQILAYNAALKNPKTPSTGSVGGPVHFHWIRWEKAIDENIFRKLINETSQAFFRLQKLAKTNEVIGNEHLVAISRQYRSVIRDCQEQLDTEEHLQNEESGHHSELLYKLELMWNLVEIICIEKTSIGIVLPQLLDWIVVHFPQADEKARKVIEESQEHPEKHLEYWEAIKLFLSQGRKDQALGLLRLHSDFGLSSGLRSGMESGSAIVDGLASLDELIRKMPLYTGNQMSSTDFELRWRQWQKETISRLDEGDFASSPDLTSVASLLSGSEEAMNDLATLCETWYQWMCGQLLFQSPSIKCYDLAFQAHKSVEKFGGLANMTSLDSVLLATFETDLSQVMHELCTTLDTFWFPAHLLDLLYHADQLDNQGQDREDGGAKIMQPGPGLREYLLLEFATSLTSHNSLWQLGVLYLDHCQTQGRQRAEALLTRTPVDSERKANKIISLASERGLSGVVNKVCKVMGMRALKGGRIGAAMTWAIRSQDVRFTTFLSDQLLKEYCESGDFNSADLLDHLGQSMIVSDRLTFLAKYREFHKLCALGDFATAAQLLHSLMWSRLAPKYFWVTLLCDAIPFLSAEEGILSAEQTYEIMHCLQELLSDKTLPTKQRLILEKNESQIRLHLVKNLAATLMIEGEQK